MSETTFRSPLVECVPNFSEGRKSEVVDRIIEAMQAVPGAVVLDYSSDPDHNRTVVTLVGPPDAVEDAAYAGIAQAAALINLDDHKGEHPRLGATDVVPFIPIRDVTMDDCVAIANRLGHRVGDDLGIPVYLYEAAATRPDRVNLANVRKGEYEGLKESIGTDPDRAPDYGPAVVGSTGATIIGARAFLVAFNVYLNTDNVEIAQKIAKVIRHSGGGLRYVKAMGLLVDGQAQVSMNLTDFKKTPVYRVVELIRREAARYGASVTFSELVGLIPEDALLDAAEWHLQLDLFSKTQILERKLAAVMAEQPSEEAPVKPKVEEAPPVEPATHTSTGSLGGGFLHPDAFVEAVAAGTAAPGGGAVAAAAGALAAGLAEMVARLTLGKKKYVDVQATMETIADQAAAIKDNLLDAVREDVVAFDEVMKAYKLPREEEGRADAIQLATISASDVPLKVAQTSLDAMKLAGHVAAQGNLNAVTDGMGGVHMALAAVEIAALNVRINAESIADDAIATAYKQAIEEVVGEARALSIELLAAAAERANLSI